MLMKALYRVNFELNVYFKKRQTFLRIELAQHNLAIYILILCHVVRNYQKYCTKFIQQILLKTFNVKF